MKKNISAKVARIAEAYEKALEQKETA